MTSFITVAIALAIAWVCSRLFWDGIKDDDRPKYQSAYTLAAYPPLLWFVSLRVADGFGAPAWVYTALMVAVAVLWAVMYFRLRSSVVMPLVFRFWSGGIVTTCNVLTVMGMVLS